MSEQFKEELDNFIKAKAMIPGSLGLWETYFKKLCLAWNRIDPEIRPMHFIFAADNGVASEGYIRYSYEITRQQATNMLLGKSAVTSYCAFNQIPYEVIDVGINSPHPIGIDGKVARGTKNFLYEPAMTLAEFKDIYKVGYARVSKYVEEGVNLFSFGEMGIGNTTTSAAVLSALAHLSPEVTVGPGSGANEEGLVKKRHIVSRGLAFHEPYLVTTEEIIRRLGGFDIAALVGAMVACVDFEVPFVIDGYITAVSMACASRIQENISNFAIPSHCSREVGMEAALVYSGLSLEDTPLRAQMALGEGTGAVLMVQLLKTIYFGFLNLGTMEELLGL